MRRPGVRRRRPRRAVRVREAILAAAWTTVSALYSGPAPPAPSPSPCSAWEGVPAGSPRPCAALAAADVAASFSAVFGDFFGASPASPPPGPVPPPPAPVPPPPAPVPPPPAPVPLFEELEDRFWHAAPEDGGLAPSSSSSPAERASPEFTFTDDRRRRVTSASRVRPPVPIRVDPVYYSGHHRVCSILSRGLKLRIPSVTPPAWRVTPSSPLMTEAVESFVSAGVLRPGRPLACYRLFPVAKSDSVARLVYDLSDLTPLLDTRPCALPTIDRALDLASQGFRFAIKVDLRDGFYHIPLSCHTQRHFGVLYRDQTYVFTKLPMGLKHAPAEMQHFSCVTAKLVEERFPGVRSLVYLDDFLFLARDSASLSGVGHFLSEVGLCLNFEKSVLTPVSSIIFLGVELDLCHCSARVKRDVLFPLRSALAACSSAWPSTWRQRLAGYVNFVRPLMKLPLEVVAAVRDGDCGACAAVLPYLSRAVVWRWSDQRAWSDTHERAVFVDATPLCIGIVRPGCPPVSNMFVSPLPIYVAEYVAALVAVFLMGNSDEPFTVYTDNVGVLYNLDKGRCPRAWLPVLLSVFSTRNFSVNYIESSCNPADWPSRALCL